MFYLQDFKKATKWGKKSLMAHKRFKEENQKVKKNKAH